MRFWDIYPKRVAKKDARKAWAELAPTPLMVERMIATLGWQVGQPAWTKDGGQFIPYPASWLRGRRWSDEQPVTVKAKMFSNAAELVLSMFGDEDEP